MPYISVETGDGATYLGRVHTRRLVECLARSLCQVCGEPLGRPMVVFVAPDKVDGRYSSEPPLHPECAQYSQAACPMLAGRMAHYSRGAGGHIGKACDVPGCDCDGWVETPRATTAESMRGKPSGPWVAVWLNDYAIAVDSTGRPHGVAWVDDPLKIRPVRGARVVTTEP